MEHFKLPLLTVFVKLPYQIEYVVYFICRTREEVWECYHSSYVVCVVVFLLGIVLRRIRIRINFILHRF